MVESRHRRFVSAKVSGLLLAALVGGCAALPRSGPTAGEIEGRFATVDNPLGVRLLPLTSDIVAAVGSVPTRSLAEIAGLRGTGSADRIGPGDTLGIAIYETAPGLFSNLQHFAPTSQSTTSAETLPPMQVEQDGTVTVPYAGRLRVAGKTTGDVRRIITAALDKASEPQVVVSVVNSQTGVVYVAGDVHNPGRFPLSMAGEHLLDVLALAGGPAKAASDSGITVTRRGVTATAPLAQVRNGGPDNIELEPLDRVQVTYTPRTYTVLGATGKVAQVPFDSDSVNLAEAIARTGGLDDARADPASMFLFRFEDPVTGRAIGLPAGEHPVPVVYHVDMQDPLTMLLSQRFAVRDHDLIYIANARSVPVSKFLGLIGQIFAPTATARVLSQ